MSELDRLEAAVGDCREMIREAHAATKDLRAAVREAKKELSALARDEVAVQIQVEVSRQLEDLGMRTSEAVSAATQKVIAGSVNRCWARRPTGKRRAAGVRPHAPTRMSYRSTSSRTRTWADASASVSPSAAAIDGSTAIIR